MSLEVARLNDGQTLVYLTVSFSEVLSKMDPISCLLASEGGCGYLTAPATVGRGSHPLLAAASPPTPLRPGSGMWGISLVHKAT